MPSPEKPAKDAVLTREAKLAQALRANLRRRKANAPAAVKATPPAKTPDQP
jgi:hypothetical protein